MVRLHKTCCQEIGWWVPDSYCLESMWHWSRTHTFSTCVPPCSMTPSSHDQTKRLFSYLIITNNPSTNDRWYACQTDMARGWWAFTFHTGISDSGDVYVCEFGPWSQVAQAQSMFGSPDSLEYTGRAHLFLFASFFIHTCSSFVTTQTIAPMHFMDHFLPSSVFRYTKAMASLCCCSSHTQGEEVRLHGWWDDKKMTSCVRGNASL